MKKSFKNDKFFKCTLCDYICRRNTDLTKHLYTRKHQNRIASNEKVVETITLENLKNSSLFVCKICNKSYVARSSHWYHEKKCKEQSQQHKQPTSNYHVITGQTTTLYDEDIYTNENTPQEYTNSFVETTDEPNTNTHQYEGEFIEYDGEPGLNAQIIALLKHVLRKNAELSDQVIQFKTDVKTDVKEQLTEFVSNIQPNNFTTNNNNNNNHFNLNIFLNDKCKDAVNISDFIQSLHLTLDDLQTVVEKGFIMGNYQIIADKFNELGIYKRPIHCSDIKRETVYVRENNEWQKETSEHPLLHKLVTHVAHKVSQQCSFWHRENPDYLQSEEKKEHSLLIMNSVLGAGNGKSIAENKARIAKNVLEFVEIDKRSEAILHR